jgi:hypothetical protein
MRIGNSAPLNGPDIQKTGTSAPQGRSRDAGHALSGSDEVALSPAGESALSNRTDRVAELTALVNSSSYAPPSAEVSKKIVSDALSRPAEHS